MGRSRTVLVASLGLALVIAVLATVGSLGVHRMFASRDRVQAASARLAAYQHVQRALTGEALAQAAPVRDPQQLAAASSELRLALAEVRRTGAPADRTTADGLLALDQLYARTTTVEPLVQMQGLLDPALARSSRELDAATDNQRVVVTRMAWRGPLVLTVSFALLGLCWLLLVRYGRHASERAKVSEQLALQDPLTGLANRRAFETALAPELDAHDSDSAVLLLDLDEFKEINDTWGHDVGDQVLKTVADRITETVRTSDLVARLGGDEFAVLVRPAAHVDALRERVHTAVAEPMHVRGLVLHPHTSIGVAPVIPGQRQEDVLRVADAALYARKRERAEIALLRQRRSRENG